MGADLYRDPPPPEPDYVVRVHAKPSGGDDDWTVVVSERALGIMDAAKMPWQHIASSAKHMAMRMFPGRCGVVTILTSEE